MNMILSLLCSVQLNAAEISKDCLQTECAQKLCKSYIRDIEEFKYCLRLCYKMKCRRSK